MDYIKERYHNKPMFITENGEYILLRCSWIQIYVARSLCFLHLLFLFFWQIKHFPVWPEYAGRVVPAKICRWTEVGLLNFPNIFQAAINKF